MSEVTMESCVSASTESGEKKLERGEKKSCEALESSGRKDKEGHLKWKEMVLSERQRLMVRGKKRE